MRISSKREDAAELIRQNALKIKSAQNAILAKSGIKLFEGNSSDSIEETSSKEETSVLPEIEALAAIKELKRCAEAGFEINTTIVGRC